jgi:hypothetical protein
MEAIKSVSKIVIIKPILNISTTFVVKYIFKMMFNNNFYLKSINSTFISSFIFHVLHKNHKTDLATKLLIR